MTLAHYWESIHGFFDYGNTTFYKKIVDQTPGPAHFVEIGSWKGRSASYMAVEIANSKKLIRFDCVDTWSGSEEHQEGNVCEDPDVVNGTLLDTFLNNMKPVAGYFTAIQRPSLEAAQLYPDNSLDFVFIDAAHDYENVRADILAWYPKVKPGGIISGHDFHHPPVVQAVTEIFPDISVMHYCWYVAK